MIFPSLLLTAVVLANLVPSLWVLFFIVSILKASAYSLNDPVKELLYQPTSVPIKYKAKAWIDVFGSRLAKAGGSFISHLAHGSVSRLQLVSELPSIVISIILLVFAWQAGTQFQYLVRNGLVVGDCDECDENGTTDKPRRVRSSAVNMELSMVNGLQPGDVGYRGYDPDAVFEGVDFDAAPQNKFGRFVSSSRRQLNNDVFRSGLGGDSKYSSSPKKFKSFKIRSTPAPVSVAGPVGGTESRNEAGSTTTDGEIDRGRSESADF